MTLPPSSQTGITDSMEKLLKAKKIQFIIAVASLAVGILSIAGIIFFILKLLYVPMAICIALTAHGFYGCPFYFLNNAKLKICIAMLAYIEQNKSADISQIAAAVGIKQEFAEKLMKKCIEKGYIENSESEEAKEVTE